MRSLFVLHIITPGDDVDDSHIRRRKILRTPGIQIDRGYTISLVLLISPREADLVSIDGSCL